MSKRIGVLVMGLAYVSMACGLLVGCGTKGPLYIPEQRYPQAGTSKPNNAPKVENKVDKSTSNSERTVQ